MSVVTRARELLTQQKIPLIYISDGSSAGNKLSTLLDQRAEAFGLLAELADEVDRLLAQLTITDEMVEQAGDVIWAVYDRHGHSGIKCRPDGGMYLYSMEAARAGLEAALGVESCRDCSEEVESEMAAELHKCACCEAMTVDFFCSQCFPKFLTTARKFGRF